MRSSGKSRGGVIKKTKNPGGEVIKWQKSRRMWCLRDLVVIERIKGDGL